jgi:hypothetical protein
MNDPTVFAVECDWLPSAELDRLLAELQPEFPGLAFTSTPDEHRSFDPAVAVALISAAATMLTPFLMKLADRLFKEEPKAHLKLGDGPQTIVIFAATSEAERRRLFDEALNAGSARLQVAAGD